MHDTNSALFACYILFIYFRGRNISRIEREMRSIGYAKFHRRILYARDNKPGWITKYDWTAALTGVASSPGNADAPDCMCPQGEVGAA